MSEIARVIISKRSAQLLREVAKSKDVSPREYLEALLHYARSIRPGSWEANKSLCATPRSGR